MKANSNRQLTQVMVDDVVVQEMTLDLSTGSFYLECDAETLELALSSIWECRDEWRARGVILGEA